MADVGDLLQLAFDRIDELEASHARLEARHERMFRYGKILDDEDVDFSDPTNPVVRIHHDDGDDGEPVKGPMVRYATWSGDRNQHNPPSKGQQFLHISPDGEFEGGLLVALGPQTAIPSPDTDPETHVDAYGKTKRTLKKDSVTHTVGGTQVHTDTTGHKITAPGQVQIAAGDASAANTKDGPSYELNRFVQDSTARHDQHEHHLTALHQEVSTMVDKLVGLCPALMDQQQRTLNHKADGLKQAADDAQGQLPEYANSAAQQAFGKVGNSPLSAVLDVIMGDVAGKMGGMLGQIGSMMGGAGLSGGAANTAQMHLGQAQNAIPAAASGGTFELDRALTSLCSLAKGSPVEGMLGDAVGQLRSMMGSTAGLIPGLSGLLNGQTNASKGKIKSALFGG